MTRRFPSPTPAHSPPALPSAVVLDDDPTLPPQQPLYRGARAQPGLSGSAAAATSTTTTTASGRPARLQGAPAGQGPRQRRAGPAQHYLDEYAYDLPALSFEGTQQTQEQRDEGNLGLIRYIESHGPFLNLSKPDSPDVPNLAHLLRNVQDSLRKVRGRRCSPTAQQVPHACWCDGQLLRPWPLRAGQAGEGTRQRRGRWRWRRRSACAVAAAGRGHLAGARRAAARGVRAHGRHHPRHVAVARRGGRGWRRCGAGLWIR